MKAKGKSPVEFPKKGGKDMSKGTLAGPLKKAKAAGKKAK